MWQTLRASIHKAHPELVDAASELVEDTQCTLIYMSGALALLLLVLASVGASDMIAMHIWFFVVPPLVATSWVALRLVHDRLLLAHVIWQVGLITAITVAILLFRAPEVAFLYTLLPLLAVITVGASLGSFLESVILVTVFALAHNPWHRVLPTYYVVYVVIGGLFCGAVAWAASRSLYTVTQWSLQSFAQAQKHTADARQHRAQLARALEDLDRAYYRLERTNSALVAAWRTAAEAERAKAEFATTLSHELRTPLNLIIGFCEMMLTAPHKYGGLQIPGPYRADLHAVFNNAQHLKALVDDVLDLARIDVGKLPLSRERVDLRRLVHEAADMVREYAEAKGLELIVNVEEDLPQLYIDRLRIRQVMLNLLVNAARFTERGYIRLNVSHKDGHILIEVEDTGCGIEQTDLPRIFEEYVQTGPATASGWPSSSGLGLPISRKFVELHGGSMGVRSAVHRGRRFWFTLPCTLEGSQEKQDGLLIRGAPLRRLASTKREVVVIHDDLRAVSLLQRYMEDYRLRGVADLEEGLALAHQSKALAIITGEEATPAALDRDRVVITCPLPRTRDVAAAMGVADVLLKPISAQDLWHAIEALGTPVHRVLVAEDDPDMIRLLRRMLAPRIVGRDCIEAHTGQEAIALLLSEHPDLMLLDLVMPEANGEEVLAAMRQHSEVASVPVIIISAKEPANANVPLYAPIRIAKGDGLRLGEIARVLQASLSALAPGWH